MYVLIKGKEDRPPNPRILVGEEEMKMRKFANRKAAEMARAQGQPASGPEWESLRNKIIEEIKSNPDSHGVSYLGDIPEGFSAGGPREADVEGEKAAIDEKFAPENDEDNKRVSYNNTTTDNRSAESYASGGETDEEFRGRNDPSRQTSLTEFDPAQTSLLDFMDKKSVAINHAWDALKNW